MNKETALSNRVMERFSQHGFTPIRMQSGLFYNRELQPVKIGINGIPDYLLLSDNSKCFWVEMKTLTGRLREDQVKFIKFLESIGHHVYVVRSVDEVDEIVRKEKGNGNT